VLPGVLCCTPTQFNPLVQLTPRKLGDFFEGVLARGGLNETKPPTSFFAPSNQIHFEVKTFMLNKNSTSAVLSPEIVGQSLIEQIKEISTKPLPINEYQKVFIVAFEGKHICHHWPTKVGVIKTLTCYSSSEQAQLGMLGSEFRGDVLKVTLGEALQLSMEKPELHGVAIVFIKPDLTVELEKLHLKDQYKD